MVRFECGSCGYKKDVDDKYGGKKVRCPKCGTSNVVSGQQASQAEFPKNLIKIYCPLCNKKIGVPPEYAGKRVRCATCKNPIMVPVAAAASSMEPPSDSIFADTQSLLNMESQAKTVNLPPELQRPPATVGMEQQTGYDKNDYAVPEVKKHKENQFNADLPIGALIGITIIIVLMGLFLNWRLGSTEKKPVASREQVQKANEFSNGFVNLLAKGEVNEVSVMLVKELQEQDPNNEALKKLIGTLGNKLDAGREVTVKLSAQETEGNVYMFGYKLQTEEPGNIFVVVSQEPNGFAVEGINCYSGNSMPILFASSRSSQISASLRESFISRFLSLMKKGLLAVMILFGITRLSKAIVFYRADEPPWAAIIPGYHEWTLAETGDISGIWGIVAFFIIATPFVGLILYNALILYFSIGIAQTHSRGILFGLGLWLLPFIFYPILVFSPN